MSNWASTAPAAKAALISLLQTALNGQGVAVPTAPQVGGGSQRLAVLIGFTDESSPESVSGSFDIGDYAESGDREQYSINCAIKVRNGSGDAEQAETDAFGLLATIGQTLAANRDLGGLVMNARVNNYQSFPVQDKRGAGVTLLFDVFVDAFTQR